MRLEKIFERKIKRIIYLVFSLVGIAIAIYGYLSFSLDYAFHLYVGVALIVALTAPAIIIHLENRRKNLIDNAFPTFLEHLAKGTESGMTLFQALEDASHRKYGPITVELRKLVAQLSFGVELDSAFAGFSSRIGTALSLRVNAILLESVKLGGDLKTILASTAGFVKEMLRLRDERESELRSYLMIVYISCFVFLALIIILYQSFFIPMASAPTRFLNLSFSTQGYKSLMFDLSIAEAIFGGLIAGKLSEGATLSGLKHSVILLAAVTVIFIYFM